MAVAMAGLVSAERVPVQTVVAIVSVTVAHAAMVEISAKTGGLVWVTPHSVRNVKPWSGLRCPCANWLRKPMVNP